MIAIQSAPLATLHAHESGAVTVKVPVAASFENAADAGETAMLQAWGAPSWRTLTACPAIVSVPDLASAPELAVTATVTVPGPEPDAPLVMVIHPRSEAAVQLHEAAVDTLIEPFAASAPKDNDDDASVNAHDAGGGVGCTGDFPSVPQATRTATIGKKRQALLDIMISDHNVSNPAASDNER